MINGMTIFSGAQANALNASWRPEAVFQSNKTIWQNKTIWIVASLALALIAVVAYVWKTKIQSSSTSSNKLRIDNQTSVNDRGTNPNYLFAARRVGKSQEGCCGDISVKNAEVVRQKLLKKLMPGISYDIIQANQKIIGTCTATSLEFASTYFNLRKQWNKMDPGSEPFLDKLRQLSTTFEKSSLEMRSRQIVFSSIMIDRSVKMDVTKSKIESWIKYHNFETDYCSKEVDITKDTGLLPQEINALPHGVYFVRMLKPEDNYKLEARGHSMIYVHEQNVGFFYDPNWGLEKILNSTLSASTNDTSLYERLLSVHQEWDIPMLRFYRLQPESSSII